MIQDRLELMFLSVVQTCQDEGMANSQLGVKGLISLFDSDLMQMI